MADQDNERILMNRKFRARLRELLNETDISQAALARSTGVSPAVISKYLSDPDKEPLFNIVAKISRYFDVSPEWLGGMSDERIPFQKGNINDIYFHLSNAGKSELYNYGQYLLTKEEQLSEDMVIYSVSNRKTNSDQYFTNNTTQVSQTIALKIIPKVADFALIVIGNSMEPLIKAGTLVFAKDQTTAANGDIVIAEVDGTTTCKQFHIENGVIELRSINSQYPPITDFSDMRIIGKVII